MATKIVKVWAPWCQPCKVYTIHFEEAHNQLGLMYPEVEWLEWNADVVDVSQYNVSVIPTTLIIHNDKLIASEVGVLETPRLIEFVAAGLQRIAAINETDEVVYGSN